MAAKPLDKWLLVQAIASLLILLAAFVPTHVSLTIRVIGGILILAGLIVGAIAFFQLGPGFTPFTQPKEEGRLVTQGIYHIVRHPLYCSTILLAFGWSLIWGTLWGVILSCILVFILDGKAKLEEELLTQKYPEYADYKRHVNKFIPFIY